MKKLLIITSLLTIQAVSFAQTVQELVEKHLEAVGGIENLQKIESVVKEGAILNSRTPIRVIISQVHNRALRKSYLVSGISGFSILTHKQGWTYMPALGQTEVEVLEETEIALKKHELDLQDILLGYIEKGYEAKLDGKEILDSKAYYCLVLNSKEGVSHRLLIDQDSYLLFRKTDTHYVDGKRLDATTEYSDYQTVQGVKMPFKMNGQFGSIHFSKMTVNEPIDERVFMPIKQGGVQ